MTMIRTAIATLFLALALAACTGSGGSGPTEKPPNAIETATFAAAGDFTPSPAVIPKTDRAANISLPQGFSAYKIATGFFRPTSIALADDGAVYISQRHGIVKRLSDADGDGVFESSATFVETSGEITGLLVAPGGGLYVSATGALLLVKDTNGDGVADRSTEIVSGLPHGEHQNNGLAVGPDGKLYLTNGSTCDDCDETDKRSATILQANPDGSNMRIFATGLRNPYDLVFDQHGRLWATDNGSDAPCATIDELNLIVDGGDYGWPYSKEGCEAFSKGIPPLASLGLHDAPAGIESYDAGRFPAAYRGNLFITLWGSFFAEPERPPQLLRATIQETAGGPRATTETFAEGFKHPIDVVADRDGTLLVLDYGEGSENDTSGTLYRIIYTS